MCSKKLEMVWKLVEPRSYLRALAKRSPQDLNLQYAAKHARTSDEIYACLPDTVLKAAGNVTKVDILAACAAHGRKVWIYRGRPLRQPGLVVQEENHA